MSDGNRMVCMQFLVFWVAKYGNQALEDHHGKKHLVDYVVK